MFKPQRASSLFHNLHISEASMFFICKMLCDLISQPGDLLQRRLPDEAITVRMRAAVSDRKRSAHMLCMILAGAAQLLHVKLDVISHSGYDTYFGQKMLRSEETSIQVDEQTFDHVSESSDDEVTQLERHFDTIEYYEPNMLDESVAHDGHVHTVWHETMQQRYAHSDGRRRRRRRTRRCLVSVYSSVGTPCLCA